MKATLKDGTVLEGTHEEVTEALRALQGDFRKSGSAADTTPAAPPSSNGSNGHGVTTVWTEKRAERLVAALYGDQQKLVTFLMDKGGFVSTDDLMKHLGFKTGNQLAGIRSSITRNARRITGYESAEVVEWAMGPKQRWGYRIISEVHELLKKVWKK